MAAAAAADAAVEYRGLFVGVDEYRDAPHARLNGCVRDTLALKDALEGEYGRDAWTIYQLFNEQATRAAILEALRGECTRASFKWLEGTSTVFWFHFSGHGGQRRNIGGGDGDGDGDGEGSESDGKDEGLYAHDYRYAGLLLDDALTRIVRQFPSSASVVVTVDACHSGSIVDGLPYTSTGLGSWRAESLSARRRLESSGGPRIFALTACEDEKTAAETREGGALTCALLSALKRRHFTADCYTLARAVAAEVGYRHPGQEVQAASTHPLRGVLFSQGSSPYSRPFIQPPPPPPPPPPAPTPGSPARPHRPTPP
jgi:hypothetical protein